MIIPRNYDKDFDDIWRRDERSDENDFLVLVMEGGDKEWDEVIEKFKEDTKFHRIMVKGKGTALHIAVNNQKDDIVKRLVEAIVKRENELTEKKELRLKKKEKKINAAINRLRGNEEKEYSAKMMRLMNKEKENKDAIIRLRDEEKEKSALRLKNEKKGGLTALHLAAYRGLTNMCKLIIGENGERKHLIEVENENGQTPLYSAVLAGEIQVFSYLRSFYKDDINIAMTNDNNSIFHEAIHREMFDLANIILSCYPALRDLRNNDGVTPFEVLATRTSAFKSGTNLPWWKLLIYYCIPVKKLDPEAYLKRIDNENKAKYISQVSIQVAPNPQSTKGNLAKEEDVTFLQILHNHIQRLVCSWQYCLSYLGMPGVSKYNSTRKKGVGLIKAIRKAKEKHIWGKQLLNEFMEEPYKSYMGDDGANPLRNEFDDEELMYEDEDEEDEEEEEEIMEEEEEEEEVESQFIKERPHDILPADEESAKKKEKETSSSKVDENEKTFLAVAKSGIVEIMEELNSKVPPPPTEDKNGLLLVAMKNIKPEESSADNIIDRKETAYLVAAKNGIVEIVSTLQSKIKIVVHDTNSKKENVLLVAVKHKQPRIVKELTKISEKRFHSLILGTDYKGNTVLHLAAGGEGTYKKKTWKIAGAAMQMMWDIKWYQYIKDMVPEQFDFRSNDDGKTPGEIFKEEHTELLEKSSAWLKDTAESCSVVAALIAGVSFATSSSVPGGTKDDSGKPILEGQPAFDAFAISSLLGLYFSVTALIMFLSILTSRKQVEDFKRNLPMKLLFGLSSLFVSIAAMLTSFCAGHFFVLTDKYKSVLFPLYVATCFPITFYAVVQFPLYLDLVKVIVKKVPPPSVIGVQL